jgi:hypothetical protein
MSQAVVTHTLRPGANSPTDQERAIANLDREYGRLLGLVSCASFTRRKSVLSVDVIKILNGVACSHSGAGEWRCCEVKVGDYIPPPFSEVSRRMDMFVNYVNDSWKKTDAVVLATYVLWKLNQIHPFTEGNGRTARVTCFFVLCLKFGGLIDGDILLPDRIRANRPEYVQALKHADATFAAGHLDLGPLHGLVTRLLEEQVSRKSS